jgi:hypothetical protein
MLLGHFAIALGAKRYAPRTSLGTLIFAAQLLDLLWPLFVLLGWEHLRIVPGLMAASPFDFVSYPYSHSLAMAILWAAVLALGYNLMRRYPRGAVVLAFAVVSHWLLDAPMHRPDLPLWPGSAIKVGGALWNSIGATVAVEALLFGLGLAVYTRATRPRDRTGTWALIALAVFLSAIFISVFFTPPPPSEKAVAWVGIAAWLFVPWGYWVDRHREARRLHGEL